MRSKRTCADMHALRSAESLFIQGFHREYNEYVLHACKSNCDGAMGHGTLTVTRNAHHAPLRRSLRESAAGNASYGVSHGVGC